MVLLIEDISELILRAVCSSFFIDACSSRFLSRSTLEVAAHISFCLKATLPCNLEISFCVRSWSRRADRYALSLLLRGDSDFVLAAAVCVLFAFVTAAACFASWSASFFCRSASSLFFRLRLLCSCSRLIQSAFPLDFTLLCSICLSRAAFFKPLSWT